MKHADWFMKHAILAAERSKDTTQVGAALVGPSGEVRLTAFNGPPKGVRDLPERFQRPEKYRYASHAEANLIAFAAREGIRTLDCTVYVTHPPCCDCTKTLIQAGVKVIVHGAGVFQMDGGLEAANIMCEEAGVHKVAI